MTTEQIDLTTVKLLIDKSRDLQSQLNTITQQLATITAERDTLANEVKNNQAAYLQEKETTQSAHAIAIKALEDQLAQTVDELKQTGEANLDKTVKTYEAQAQTLKANHADELKKITDELTKKNASILKELQQTQASHRAVIDRIRGIES